MSPYFNFMSRDFNLKSSYFNLNSFYFNLRVKRCRHPKHFTVPFASRNYRLFALSCSAPRIWNSTIASKFKDIENVPKSKITLKKHIRKYFFKEYSKILPSWTIKKSHPCRTRLPRVLFNAHLFIFFHFCKHLRLAVDPDLYIMYIVF